MCDAGKLLMVCGCRLQGLEKKILSDAGETPTVVYEMKKQVDLFRQKLEVPLNHSVEKKKKRQEVCLLISHM